ncbi:hypothetical protein MHM39_03055 [Phaeobacter sp. CNT1-3]|nr:hypothetical protein [Phaeobacter sp. CNT1-3]
MSVRLAHNGLPSDITPYQLKKLLRRARGALGLSKGAVEYLVFAIDNCQKADFQKNRICAIWYSLERLADSFDVSKRQIGRIEAELVRAGLIKRTYPERKERSGDRVDGVIKRAAGINLAPLIEQAEHLRLLACRQISTKEKRSQLRKHIQDLFRQIRDLADSGADQAATKILPRRRPAELNDIEAMQQVSEALEAVLSDFSTIDSQPQVADGSDKNVRLNTNTEKKNKTRMAVKASDRSRSNTTPAHARLLAAEQFGAHIDFYANGSPPDYQSITRAARDRAHELGISRRLWEEMCTRIGVWPTALCLIVADRNSQRKEDDFGRDNAAASFTEMARSEAREAAVLDSLIGELTHAVIQSEGEL